MNIWTILLPILLDFLEKCMDDRTEGEILAGMRSPGAIETIALRRAVRKGFPELKRIDRRAKVADAVATLASATDAELAAIVAEAADSRD